MKDYTATYLAFFGYTTADFIHCEICSKRSIDLHHIWARSIRKTLENDIRNIMAVCRECHVKYGDKKQHREFLQDIHDKVIANRK